MKQSQQVKQVKQVKQMKQTPDKIRQIGLPPQNLVPIGITLRKAHHIP